MFSSGCKRPTVGEIILIPEMGYDVQERSTPIPWQMMQIHRPTLITFFYFPSKEMHCSAKLLHTNGHTIATSFLVIVSRFSVSPVVV